MHNTMSDELNITAQNAEIGQVLQVRNTVNYNFILSDKKSKTLSSKCHFLVAVLRSTHNLCFGAKIKRKKICKPL